MKKMIIFSLIILVAVTSGCFQGGGSAEDISTINAKLDSMNAKLKAMEDKLEILTPSFAQLMPEYAERFHVMHFAGDAEDWAVAKHELLEMEKLRETGELVDPPKEAMFKAFEEAYLGPVQEAIENQDHNEFVDAIDKVPKGCNNCHVAVGSQFINVTLEVPTALSLRHPHVLEKSEIAEEHMQEHAH